MAKLLMGLFFFLQMAAVHGQELSTYFVDSLKIVINNETLLNSGAAKIYYWKNTRDTQIVLYQKAPYRLVVSFENVEPESYLVQTGLLKLFMNDKPLNIGVFGGAYADCECDMQCGYEGLSNSLVEGAEPESKTLIRAAYRYTFLAPADTAGYRARIREGLWTGRYDLGRNPLRSKVYVKYTADLKDSTAYMIWEDKGRFETSFQNGRILGEGHFDLEQAAKSQFRRRQVPAVIFYECLQD